LHISPFREGGLTYGTPTWIWCVAVDDALYVRGYNGQKSSWYQAAVRQKGGRIIAAGMTKLPVLPRWKTEATFECRTLAAARASRKKRSRADSSPRYRSLMTFNATGHRRSTSNAL
jgi:Uncharacterized protein conserved in bacteria (DUF2255)